MRRGRRERGRERRRDGVCGKVMIWKVPCIQEVEILMTKD